MQVITKKKHLGIISRMVNHSHYIRNKAPISYLVGRIRQMFPEYRDISLKSDLTKQVRELKKR